MSDVGSTAFDRRDLEPVLLVERLSKRYGWRTALAEVTFSLRPGECLVIFGPNGAGKTTLLRVLSGLIRPSSGTIRWFGLPFPREAASVRSRIGVVGHRTMLDPELTVVENLDYYARLYGVPDRHKRIEEVLASVGLLGRRHQRVRELSRGLQQRVALARAVLHEPEVLLLDEPDTGLDREGRECLAQLIRRHRSRGGSVLMATHALEFGAALADRALTIERGRLVGLAETPSAVAESVRRSDSELVPA